MVELTQTVIEVTEPDIVQGSRHDSYMCPIALAVKRVIVCYQVAEDYIAVGVRTIALGGAGNRFVVAMPQNAIEFIYNFDFGNPVESFSFTADLPTHMLRKPGHQEAVEPEPELCGVA